MDESDTTGSNQVEKTTSQPSNRFRSLFAVGGGLFVVAFVLISQICFFVRQCLLSSFDCPLVSYSCPLMSSDFPLIASFSHHLVFHRPLIETK